MKKSLKYLFLLVVSSVSLTSCLSYPSNYVGFKVKRTGEFAIYQNIAYIYEQDKEYSADDDIVLDLYFGREEGHGRAYGDMAIYISDDISFYIFNTKSEYEEGQYKNPDRHNMFYILEVEEDLFNTEEYEYQTSSGFGRNYGCEFNHHELITLPANLKEFMFTSSTSLYFHLCEIDYFPDYDECYINSKVSQQIYYEVKDNKLSFI